MRKQRGSVRAANPSGWKQRTLIGVAAIGITMAVTAGAAYADVDLKGKILAWAGIETATAISGLETAISQETELQKKRLQEQLRADLLQQEAEFEQYAEQEKAVRIQEIRNYADELLRSRSFDNEQQKQDYASQLAGIVESARSTMSGLNVPAAPTVTEEVYNSGQP
ncbi:hypothetical protein [Paenibacillus herberti]|uniref:Uncharacterized protein n=1 Tax=Paenibacillus herberti TaxID=1619309 RepID=A0A229NWV3_9BACL|nr:hypothetical protein [Paenibacillus herberti]OXM14338.1 hypothetical protein CGZ75_15425 [Paenibacillus herberti]